MKKRRLIIVIFVVLLVGLPLLVFLSKNNSAIVPATITAKPVKKPTVLAPTTRVPDTYNFNTYKEQNYTLYYPNTWLESKSEMANKTGTVFLLQPQDASQLSHPHIAVEIVDAKLDSVEHMTAEFNIFGYKKTAVTIQGMPATKYQRSVPSSQGTLNSTAYIYQKNDKIYFFKLGYMQQTEDAQLEEQLKQVATNFTIQE